MATLSAKETARELGTNPRTLRKFLRSITPKDEQPGQGNRWSVETKQLKKLKKQFADWQKPKADPSTNGAKSKTDAVIDSEDELIDVDEDLTIEEPADEDILEIELEDIEELES
jgi:hypothetical protein